MVRKQFAGLAGLMVMVLALGYLGPTLLAGCQGPTAAQKQTLDAMQTKLDAIATQAVALQADAASVVADIQAKKIPVETGMALLQKIVASKDALQTQVQEIAAQMQSLQASGMSTWERWMYLGGMGIGAILSTFFGVKLSGLGTLLQTVTAAFGVLSRSVDAAPGPAPEAVKTVIAKAVTDGEIPGTVMKDLHAQATAGVI